MFDFVSIGVSSYKYAYSYEKVVCSVLIFDRLILKIYSISIIVMQEASDAHSKTADSDTVSTYQVSSVQLATDKKLEAFNKA